MSSLSLSINDLSVSIENKGKKEYLLDSVSLELKAGEILALIGASGSGKSLTCNASLGVLPVGLHLESGSVSVDGQIGDPKLLRGRVIASVMQNPQSAFNSVCTMRQHAFETFRALSIVKSEWLPRITKSMLESGLEDPERILNLYPFEMSGGMLQRMMVALALSSEAPFLFADEPTTDLDLIVQREILELLEILCLKRHLGILLITHDIGVVASIADRVAVMDRGRIIERGSVQDIFYNPQCIQTRQLVDAHLSLYQLDSVSNPLEKLS